MILLFLRSHPVRGAWIEIWYYNVKKEIDKSHPVRGAWIEIQPMRGLAEREIKVASRKGCVD